MKIIIGGCGTVGYTLAQELSKENHDITVVDTNPLTIDQISTELDVIGVTGTCSSLSVLSEAGVETADILIAVTDRDEVNLLASLIAKKKGHCQTIARVRNPEYYEEIGFLRTELGVSMVVNPELSAAGEIARLIQLPSATEIDTFAKGRVNLIKFEVTKESQWGGKTVSQVSSSLSGNFLICILQRQEEVIIPDGNTVLQTGDQLSVMVSPESTGELFDALKVPHHQIKNVIIAGGSRIAFYLARALIAAHIHVKIIEKDHIRCEILSEQLPKAMIIEADASNSVVLSEEGLSTADAFIALTERDEENIMLSLYANKVSRAKRITKIGNLTFSDVINEIPIGSVISPKDLTAENIIGYVRSLSNPKGSNVETVYRLVNNKVEALEFFIREDSPITDIRLADLKLKSGVLVCSIVRSGRLIVPSGSDTLNKGDSVIIVTTHLGLNDISEILE